MKSALLETATGNCIIENNIIASNTDAVKIYDDEADIIVEEEKTQEEEN